MPGRSRREPAPIAMSGDEFRRLGHRLVDRLATFLDGLPDRRVTAGEPAPVVRAALGRADLPDEGAPADRVLDEAADLLIEHSLFNGHPRFLGYITSAPAPIGMLGDLLASALNPNLGGWPLSPMASEIELQTVRWTAQLLGYPSTCGGLLVSGGNVANFVGFWVGRRVRLGEVVRSEGLPAGVRVYTSQETHTWIQKAADLSGLGTDAVRFIPVDAQQAMDVEALQRALDEDEKAGRRPLMVVGTAGSVSTGAIDPLRALSDLCRARGLWFHVDGAYGAPAAALSESPDDLHALAEADSVAIDPHKWLYAPLEAGCALVRDPSHLRATFAYHPPYYPDLPEGEDPPVFFHELGPQNSRGFRALKVWLALRQVGRRGYEGMIREDVGLARYLFERAQAHPELEAVTCSLSIATFRYRPRDAMDAESVDALNKELLERLMVGGEAFVSNAVVDGRFLLRACIVNFRTTEVDVDAVLDVVVRLGRALTAERAAAASQR